MHLTDHKAQKKKCIFLCVFLSGREVNSIVRFLKWEEDCVSTVNILIYLIFKLSVDILRGFELCDRFPEVINKVWTTFWVPYYSCIKHWWNVRPPDNGIRSAPFRSLQCNRLLAILVRSKGIFQTILLVAVFCQMSINDPGKWLADDKCDILCTSPISKV